MDSAWKAAFRGEAEGESQQVGTSHLGDLESGGRIISISQSFCRLVPFFSFSLGMSLELALPFLLPDSRGPLGKEE